VVHQEIVENQETEAHQDHEVHQDPVEEMVSEEHQAH